MKKLAIAMTTIVLSAGIAACGASTTPTTGAASGSTTGVTATTPLTTGGVSATTAGGGSQTSALVTRLRGVISQLVATTKSATSGGTYTAATRAKLGRLESQANSIANTAKRDATSNPERTLIAQAASRIATLSKTLQQRASTSTSAQQVITKTRGALNQLGGSLKQLQSQAGVQSAPQVASALSSLAGDLKQLGSSTY